MVLSFWLISWGYIMLSNIWKILPFFIVEYMAKRKCEQFYITPLGRVVQPFKNVTIKVKGGHHV